MSGTDDDARPSAARRLATLLCLAVLTVVLARWVGEEGTGSLRQLGERLWPGYSAELRREPEPPPPLTPAAEPTAATTKAEAAPACAPLPGSPEFDALDDLARVRVLECIDAADATAKAAEPACAPLPGSPEFDALDDLARVRVLECIDAADATTKAGDAAPTPVIDPIAEARDRAAAAAQRHADAVATYEDLVARRTPALRAFAAVDNAISAAILFLNDHIRHAFLILIALGGWVATATRQHIGMRPIHGRAGDRVAQLASLIANLLLIAAVIAQTRAYVAAGTGEAPLALSGLWIAAFAGMSVINVVHLVRPRPPAADEGPLRALLCAPLYASMAIAAGLYFLVVDDYPEGLAVYLEMLLGNASLYLNVALYVWAGMMLRRSALAERCFDVVRPFGLAPELLTIVVVVASALPTAYSGASGIFVIAAGALIYRELKAAGARTSLALASTAMSGSLGVVLSPCLLVVIVAYLCNDVGSEELFAWGRWVYLLTAALFAAVVLITRQGPLRPAPLPGALGQSARALAATLPYVGSLAAVLVVFKLALGTGLDQDSAPFILPIWLLLALWIERRRGRGASRAPVRAATAETTVHIGALLLLMALSAGLGGVIERSGLIASLPLLFASPWQAMAGLAAALVVIGMIMDPYGAVILVNATLFAVAKKNGIDAIHFWMVVLVAFELGYLTPPVALNHLLTRQVVGEEDEVVLPGASLWRRHERVLLPITVMVIALAVVAFAPLIVGGR